MRIRNSRGQFVRRKISFNIFLAVAIAATVATVIFYNGRNLSYFFRPVWDQAPKPFTIIPHYFAENVSIPQLCRLHGWRPRYQPRRVFDAIIFSNEIDLLEIRYRELLPVVTKFLLVESERTFTGRPKPLLFNESRERFKFMKDKLEYGATPGQELGPGEDPFEGEKSQRIFMNTVIKRAGVDRDDLLIMSDVDEIPSAHTIKLLQWCNGWTSPVHLQMTNYLHSMEFLVDHSSWRSSVHTFDPQSTGYAHSRQSDFLFADSGWHCSFCFRYIDDFIFKMTAYSHADRVRSSTFLDPDRIQSIICEGRDLFDMLPEEYTFRELLAKLGPVPKSYSGVHLPSHLLENADRFMFLLPGSCIRESKEGDKVEVRL